MRPDLALASYAHACAVLGTGVPAEQASILGLRRGGRSRSSVLGHTRHEAVARSGDALVLELEGAEPEGLGELARALTFTRPAVERAVVDLDTRQGLDRAGLGRALGLAPAAAAAKAAEVMLEWQRALDPVLLVRMGPGTCEGLAALLDVSPDVEDDAAAADDRSSTTTLGALIDAGEVVASHAEGCALCRDRLRAMVSVRTLLSREPIGSAPVEVVEAAAHARQHPSGLPPALTGERVSVPRRWPYAASASAVVAICVAVVGGVLAAAGGDDDDTRVQALTRLPASGMTLEVVPSLVDSAPPESVVLRNLSGGAVRWHASADKPWVRVSPAIGSLDAGGSERLALELTGDAPEGDVRGAVTITGDDGSTAVVRLRTAVSHPPDVATSIAGCTVTASVEDESEVTDVVLWWRDGGVGGRERSQAMQQGDAGYIGVLPASAGGSSWWVTAADALGNEARTADQQLQPGAC